MGWSIGFDNDWDRDIGYGVIAYCDHPDCNETINRGLSHVCADEEPYGGDGCGLYFCSKHLVHSKIDDDDRFFLGVCCERCAEGDDSFDPKPEHPHWAWWKLNAKSWAKWRKNLNDDEYIKWLMIADQYKPTTDDIKEAKEDE